MAKKKITESVETEQAKLDREELEAALHSANPYDKIKKQLPPREVELPAVKLPEKEKAPSDSGSGSGSGSGRESGDPYKTISQAMESSVDLTDMQYALRILMPRETDYNDPHYDPLLVADVSPEVFLAGFHLTAMDEIMSTDPRRPIDVTKIHVKHYTRWSIPLDREGRMDVADIAGAARAEKKLQSSLGLRGMSS